MRRWALIGASSFSGTAFRRFLREKHPADEVEELSRPFFDLTKRMDIFKDALHSQRPHYIVNFAALNMVAESWKHYADYYQTNLIGVSRLAEIATEMPWLRRFVQVSTPEVYGAQHTMLAEDTPYNPSTPYAVSRAAIDMHLMALHRTASLPVVFTRSVNVYGPGQPLYRVIPKTVMKIIRGQKLELHGGGQSARSFIHIDDVSASIYLVATHGAAGAVYHTSTEKQTRIVDLVWDICGLMGVNAKSVIVNVPERPGKDMAYQLSSERIRGELKWRDRIDFSDGLRETVQWFKERAEDYAGESLEYTHRR